MPKPGWFVGVLWLAWLVSWLLAAGWTAATRSRGSRIEQLRYRVPTWIGAILLFAPPQFLGPLLHPVYPEPVVLGWGAAAFVLLGLAWTWWARIHLGPLWSGNVAVKEGHSVVRTGPYRLTRHPIYSGLLLALLATAVIRDSWAAFVGWVLIVVALVIKLRQEEKLLLTTLGPAYAQYQAEVPALVPLPRTTMGHEGSRGW
ncbi:MAG TPA: isoprenylcysteine carboxylmethyltransferase family protein [Gemmatimonadales bacterium]|jgi:protein-S-isoprenylcysteine O-methyltransferase Ste14|nr:isoprenylcysteine carboxylmethyltransferase family protein [Gemmatimonadales bacterium]